MATRKPRAQGQDGAGQSKAKTRSGASRARARTGGTAPRGRTTKGAPASSNPQGRRGDERVLERGDVFFVYRPDVDQGSPGGLLDVRRFHVILRPEGQERLRVLTVGRKMLPEASDDDGNPGNSGRGNPHWAYVERVLDSSDALRENLGGASYETETLGERNLPPARPAGEGVYVLARAGRGTALLYALELPEEPGEVQRAFHIGREGRYAVSVKNPRAASPAGVGLTEDRRAEFPEELLARFGTRKRVPLDPPAFLDVAGAEFVLVAGQDTGLGDPDGDDTPALEPQPEDEDTSELLDALRPEGRDAERARRPLFEGTWD